MNSALEDQKKIEKAAILAETMKKLQPEKTEKVIQTAAASTSSSSSSSSSSNSDGGGFTIDEVRRFRNYFTVSRNSKK